MFTLTNKDEFNLTSSNIEFLKKYGHMKEEIDKHNISKEVEKLKDRIAIKAIESKDCTEEQEALENYKTQLADLPQYQIVG